mmetsp:Transcript_10530/g.31719  ORF Transcript_10530/g.31719 Transcript_10530/m.31719 type:complete len:388 (+) Transcript_10530:1336-2499(+)
MVVAAASEHQFAEAGEGGHGAARRGLDAAGVGVVVSEGRGDGDGGGDGGCGDDEPPPSTNVEKKMKMKTAVEALRDEATTVGHLLSRGLLLRARGIPALCSRCCIAFCLGYALPFVMGDFSFAAFEGDFDMNVATITIILATYLASPGLHVLANRAVVDREADTGVDTRSALTAEFVLGLVFDVFIPAFAFGCSSYAILAPNATLGAWLGILTATNFAGIGVTSLLGLVLGRSAGAAATAVAIVLWVGNGVAPQSTDQLEAALGDTATNAFQAVSYLRHAAVFFFAAEMRASSPGVRAIALDRHSDAYGVPSHHLSREARHAVVALVAYGLVARLLCGVVETANRAPYLTAMLPRLSFPRIDRHLFRDTAADKRKSPSSLVPAKATT